MSIRFVLGIMIGLIVGASIALALAPQAGSTTRHELWEKVTARTQPDAE